MFLGCFFQDCLQTPVGIHLLFPVLANPWLLKLNLIWEIVKIILIPEGATMEVCHSNLLLLGAQLTNGPSYRPLGCTALMPFGFQTMTAWWGMKAGRPFPTRHGTQGLPIGLAEHFSELLSPGFFSPRPSFILLSFHTWQTCNTVSRLFLLSLLPPFPRTSGLFLASAQQIQPIVPSLVKGEGVVINLFNNGQFQSTNNLATGSGLPS